MCQPDYERTLRLQSQTSNTDDTGFAYERLSCDDQQIWEGRVAVALGHSATLGDLMKLRKRLLKSEISQTISPTSLTAERQTLPTLTPPPRSKSYHTNVNYRAWPQIALLRQLRLNSLRASTFCRERVGKEIKQVLMGDVLFPN